MSSVMVSKDGERLARLLDAVACVGLLNAPGDGALVPLPGSSGRKIGQRRGSKSVAPDDRRAGGQLVEPVGPPHVGGAQAGECGD